MAVQLEDFNEDPLVFWKRNPTVFSKPYHSAERALSVPDLPVCTGIYCAYRARIQPRWVDSKAKPSSNVERNVVIAHFPQMQCIGIDYSVMVQWLTLTFIIDYILIDLVVKF